MNTKLVTYCSVVFCSVEGGMMKLAWHDRDSTVNVLRCCF